MNIQNSDDSHDNAQLLKITSLSKGVLFTKSAGKVRDDFPKRELVSWISQFQRAVDSMNRSITVCPKKQMKLLQYVLVINEQEQKDDMETASCSVSSGA